MRITLPHSRASFTNVDFEFISRTLLGESKNPSTLNELFECPDSLDSILDDKTLFRALLEASDTLLISLHLYFYILVRNIFMQNEISDREVADYIAAVLSNYSQHQINRKSSHDRTPALPYVVDVLEQISTTRDPQRFELTIASAEILIIMTGIFPDYIEARRERRAAPSITYYEAFGKSQYEVAGHHSIARQLQVDHIYTEVSRLFPEIRSALNDMRERLITIEPLPYLPENPNDTN